MKPRHDGLGQFVLHLARVTFAFGNGLFEAANLILNDNEILIVEKMTRPANRDPRCLSQSHPNGRRVAGGHRRTEDEK